MSLEKIVRPFQTRDVSPAQVVHSPMIEDQGNVKLAFGRSGSGKTMNGSYSITVTAYCARAVVEKTSDSANPRPFG